MASSENPSALTSSVEKKSIQSSTARSSGNSQNRNRTFDRDALRSDTFFRLDAARERALMHTEQFLAKQQEMHSQNPERITMQETTQPQHQDSQSLETIKPNRNSSFHQQAEVEYDLLKRHLLFDLHTIAHEIEGLQGERAYLDASTGSTGFAVSGWFWVALSMGLLAFSSASHAPSSRTAPLSRGDYHIADGVARLLGIVALTQGAKMALHYNCLQRLQRRNHIFGKALENGSELYSGISDYLTGFEWDVLRWT